MRFSLFALQEMFDARLSNRTISHDNYRYIMGLICDAKFDEEERATAESIWEIPQDESCYAAILAALGHKPLTLPVGTGVIPVSYQAEQSNTTTLVAGKSSAAVDIVSGNVQETCIPQVAGDVSLDIDLKNMTLVGDKWSTDNDVITKSSNEDVDVKDMPGLTKEQVDKSCSSGIPECASQAPSNYCNHREPGSLAVIKNIKETCLLL